MSDLLSSPALAFIAGALWMEQHTRVANDGDGKYDLIQPSSEEVQAAAVEYATRQRSGEN